MSKYFTHYRGYMIFQSPNGFYPPGIDKGITCNTVEETQKVIDLYLLSQKDAETDDNQDSGNPEVIVDISLSLRWWNNIEKNKSPETLN